jgi:signal transduction histidine kinase
LVAIGKGRSANLKFSQRLSWLLPVAAGAMLSAATGLAFWLSTEQTSIAQDGVQRMIDGGVSAVRHAHEALIADNAQWTPANEAARSGDVEWLAENIGTTAFDSHTVDVMIVFDPGTGMEWGWRLDGDAKPEADLLDAEALDAVFSALAAAPERPDDSVSFFSRSGDAVVLLAGRRLTPSEGASGPDADNLAPRLVGAVTVTPERLAQIGSRFLIEDVRLAMAPPNGKAAVALPGHDGAATAWAVWTAPEPGLTALRRLALPLCAAVVLFLGLVWLAARRLALSACRLETALVAAEAADRAKGDFLASISHELRTPLNGVLGTLQLLGRTPLEPKQARFVDVARRSAEQQLELVEQLLQVSRVESGRFILSMAPFDAAACLRETVELLEPLATKKRLALSLDIFDGAGQPVLGDRAAFAQVTTNLIGNAIKFTERGSVAVSLAARRSLDQTGLTLKVSDTGPGIAPGDQARIFGRFVQVGALDDRRAHGAGLGLAIVKGLVDLMGGSISVRSSPGEGSVFSVDLILEAAAMAEA